MRRPRPAPGQGWLGNHARARRCRSGSGRRRVLPQQLFQVLLDILPFVEDFDDFERLRLLAQNQVWLARFGRTVGSHVVDALGSDSEFEPESRLEMDVGYGFRLAQFHLSFSAASPSGTPYAARRS